MLNWFARHDRVKSSTTPDLKKSVNSSFPVWGSNRDKKRHSICHLLHSYKQLKKNAVLLVLEETHFTGLFNLHSTSALFCTPAFNISLCFTCLYLLLLSHTISCLFLCAHVPSAGENTLTARERPSAPLQQYQNRHKEKLNGLTEFFYF